MNARLESLTKEFLGKEELMGELRGYWTSFLINYTFEGFNAIGIKRSEVNVGKLGKFLSKASERGYEEFKKECFMKYDSKTICEIFQRVVSEYALQAVENYCRGFEA